MADFLSRDGRPAVPALAFSLVLLAFLPGEIRGEDPPVKVPAPTDSAAPGMPEKSPPESLELAAKRVFAVTASKPRDLPVTADFLDGDEILRTPGALMDVQRVVQKLPGVQSRGDNVNEVIARGGFPGENLFILDDMEIPNPNHFGNQGTGGGVISILNPLLVQGLSFNAGAPPARYGEKVSSVLDVQLRDGNDQAVFGGVDLGFAGTGIYAEGPVRDGSTFLASFRKSYLDIVAEFEPSTAIPEFWGGQGKWTLRSGPGKLGVNGVYGRSSIRIRDAEESFGTEGDVIEAGGGVHALGGTWSLPVGNDWEFRTTLSTAGSTFLRKQYFADRRDEALSSRTTREQEAVWKGTAMRGGPGETRWTAGAELRWMEFRDANRGIQDTVKRYASPDDSAGVPWIAPDGNPVLEWMPPDAYLESRKGALHAAVDFPLGRSLALSLGARGEWFEYAEDLFLMPRAAFRWTLRDGMTLSSSAGLQTQAQNSADYAARPGNVGLPSKRSQVAALEFDWYPPGLNAGLSVNAYVKGYENLILDSAFGAGDPAFLFQTSPARRSDGTALSRGLEIYLERKMKGNWFAGAAYSLSRSETAFPGLDGGRAYPSDFDYTHVANLTGGAAVDLYKHAWYRAAKEALWFKSLCWLIPLGDRVEASFRFRHSTGRPYTPATYDESFRRWVVDPGAVNSARYPYYQTLDLRLDRRLVYGWLHLMFYLDIQNVLNRENVFTYFFNDHTGRKVTVNQLPFFPMGGFIVGF